MVPAILTDDKVVTGPCHGDAFSQLTEIEKNGNVTSGFLDCQHHKFITDQDQVIYLKEIIVLRHAESTDQENGPLTDLGKIQANKVSKLLLSFPIKGFVGFHSPYQRCIETSQIIEENCHIPFTLSDNLCKKINEENESDFCKRSIQVLDLIPEKSILITHTDFIQKFIKIFNCNVNIGKIKNCSITHIQKNKIILLAKEIGV
jgi:broad specificity phosphatase PhoE